MKNPLAHYRKISVVQFEGHKHRQTIQTKTHALEAQRKPHTYKHKKALKFSATDLYSEFVTVN